MPAPKRRRLGVSYEGLAVAISNAVPEPPLSTEQTLRHQYQLNATAAPAASLGKHSELLPSEWK